jgi:hypothetical protein
VHRLDGVALACQPLGKKLAQLNVIVNEENPVHSLPPPASDPILDDPAAGEIGLYLTLLCLTNLYRAPFHPMLKSKHGQSVHHGLPSR